ncbi:hypothetical protein [Ruminococcus sp.]|uniref:hypothetical protein n=1 Tax=Ruminococcus sp. TaxID=41978 RepID=UPI003866E656
MFINELWDEVVRHSGKKITAKDGKSFTYSVTESNIFIPEANWRITKAEFENAVSKLKDQKFATLAENSSSYVYAIIFSILKENK